MTILLNNVFAAKNVKANKRAIRHLNILFLSFCVDRAIRGRNVCCHEKHLFVDILKNTHSSPFGCKSFFDNFAAILEVRFECHSAMFRISTPNFN